MPWTREERYRNYAEWSDVYKRQLKEKAAHSPWRLGYHIQPDSGLLNDPNGFSFFNNQWHLFYQHYPFGPVHGLKSWYHLVSDDLTHWHSRGEAILPDMPYDSHGAYSGSALPIDNQLFIMYTGNVRDENWVRYPYQLGAMMNMDGQIKKMPQPLIAEPPDNVSDHFRDPQVIRRHGYYYCLLGAQEKESASGHIAVYRSPDIKNWTYLGFLDLSSYPMGFMIECPNLIFIQEQPVLIFCPQGLDQTVLDYQNIYPNVYLVGSRIDLDQVCFDTEMTAPLNLDDGFDAYATQAFNAPDGRALAVSWIGLPEITYPTDSYGWAHCLSLVKELELKDGKLFQKPVREMQALRRNAYPLTGNPDRDSERLTARRSASYEIKLEVAAGQTGHLLLAAGPDRQTGLDIRFDTERGRLSVDRSKAGTRFAEAYGTVRSVSLPEKQALTLDVFFDHSVCEIFVNDGERVLTLRLFPDKGQTGIYLSGEPMIRYNGAYWDVEKTNEMKTNEG
ncbi:sucrose-6-phosphate hydrolase [Sporolactobacillus sp. THM7-7]|nr:sucrose-6-phosphate hydrolase [Sporolactobacillus sp. THM7-7]